MTTTSSTGFASVGGLQICYETFGQQSDPALLLVMGFTAQMTAWDASACEALAARGRFVIRFDNRDCGLSTHLDGVQVDLRAVLKAWESGGPMPAVPYSLSDMGRDAFGVLDHLGIERAHIVGASMGGMIVQTMAIDQPDRVLSLTSIMSTTGERDYYTWNAEARQALMTPAPSDRDGYIAHSVRTSQILGSPRHFDPVASAQRAGAAFDRAYYPEGAVRQTAAIRSSGHRADGLRKLRVPTLVIHGRADPLIQMIGGLRTAEVVTGANLLLLNDMGHDLPKPLWPLIADALISHTTHQVG